PHSSIISLFPYTTLFRSYPGCGKNCQKSCICGIFYDSVFRHIPFTSAYDFCIYRVSRICKSIQFFSDHPHHTAPWREDKKKVSLDRKSTLLNSSHVSISY